MKIKKWVAIISSVCAITSMQITVNAETNQQAFNVAYSWGNLISPNKDADVIWQFCDATENMIESYDKLYQFTYLNELYENMSLKDCVICDGKEGVMMLSNDSEGENNLGQESATDSFSSRAESSNDTEKNKTYHDNDHTGSMIEFLAIGITGGVALFCLKRYWINKNMQRVSQMIGVDMRILSKLPEEYYIQLMFAMDVKDYRRMHEIIENGYNAHLLECISYQTGIPKYKLKRRGEACVDRLIETYKFASKMGTTEEMLYQQLMQIITENGKDD